MNNIERYLNSRQVITRVTSEQGLTQTEVDCLLYLGYNNCLAYEAETLESRDKSLKPIGGIQDALRIPQSSVSTSIKSLRAKRLTDLLIGTDSRAHLVGLTEAGKKAYDSIAESL